MKPRTLAALLGAFVVVLAGLLLLGPELIDLLAGPPAPPPVVPLGRPPGAIPAPAAPAPPPAAGSAPAAAAAPAVPAAPPPAAPAAPAGAAAPSPAEAAAPAAPAEVAPPEEPPAAARPAAVVESQGYLTLAITPPGISVLHKGVELGKTPLRRVPLPAGKQALACVDARGKRKLLAITIKPGKELKVSLAWARMK